MEAELELGVKEARNFGVVDWAYVTGLTWALSPSRGTSNGTYFGGEGYPWYRGTCIPRSTGPSQVLHKSGRVARVGRRSLDDRSCSDPIHVLGSLFLRHLGPIHMDPNPKRLGFFGWFWNLPHCFYLCVVDLDFRGSASPLTSKLSYRQSSFDPFRLPRGTLHLLKPQRVEEGRMSSGLFSQMEKMIFTGYLWLDENFCLVFFIMAHGDVNEMSSHILADIDWVEDVVLLSKSVIDEELLGAFRRTHVVCSEVSEEARSSGSFTSFEEDMLYECRVAPTQLHPNSWGFMKAFQFVYWHVQLDLFVRVFFYFFHLTKPFSRKKSQWASFHSQEGPRIFSLYEESFHDFKNYHFKVRAVEDVRPCFENERGEYQFHLYWYSGPESPKFDLVHLDDGDKEIAKVLSQCCAKSPFNTKTLLTRSPSYIRIELGQGFAGQYLRYQSPVYVTVTTIVLLVSGAFLGAGAVLRWGSSVVLLISMSLCSTGSSHSRQRSTGRRFRNCASSMPFRSHAYRALLIPSQRSSIGGRAPCPDVQFHSEHASRLGDRLHRRNAISNASSTASARTCECDRPASAGWR
ncbi:hypothetical protein PIB30_071666 [Stylosanthes scabra]|uniref:Uncharacterized protein n=1 Tax=Stylosanthes scabra TaxID=79078 RepID=A0ABU6SPJ0_9FABA|nr:hypothetical protein [Stylosanthes scabra]